MTRLKKAVTSFGVPILAIGLAACSSSGHNGSTATTAGGGNSSATTAGGGSSGSTPSGSPLSVGLICDCTGDFGTNIAPVADVGKAWSDMINSQGGIDGHPVKLTVKDTGSLPGTSLTDLQGMISGHTDVILDDSNYDSTWSSAVSAAKIPIVGGNFTTPQYYTDADWFPSGETNDSISTANVAVAKQAGASKMADLYCAESPQCAESAPLIAAAGKAAGVPVAYTSSISMSAPNYTAQCLAAKQAGVGAVFIGDSSTIIARVGLNCNQQGYNPAIVTEGTGFGMILANSKGTSNSLWSDYPDIPFWDTASPAVQTMNTWINKVKPGLIKDPNAWTEYAEQTWTGLQLIADGAKAGIGKSGTPSASAMLTGLNSIRNDTLDGMAPPLSFTSSAHKVDCWYTARLQNGKPELADGGKLTCAS